QTNRQTISKQASVFEPDPEPCGEFLFLSPLLGAHPRTCAQARGALLPLERERPDELSACAVGSLAILPVERVQLAKRSLGAFEVAEFKDALQAAGVGLLHRPVNEAVIKPGGEVDARARLAEDARDV